MLEDIFVEAFNASNIVAVHVVCESCLIGDIEVRALEQLQTQAQRHPPKLFGLTVLATWSAGRGLLVIQDSPSQ